MASRFLPNVELPERPAAIAGRLLGLDPNWAAKAFRLRKACRLHETGSGQVVSAGTANRHFAAHQADKTERTANKKRFLAAVVTEGRSLHAEDAARFLATTC